MRSIVQKEKYNLSDPVIVFILCLNEQLANGNFKDMAEFIWYFETDAGSFDSSVYSVSIWYVYPYRGRLVQYTYHLLGRKDLSGKMEVFSTVRRISGSEDLDIITFKYVEQIRGKERLNKAGIHFGNSTGLNLLSGKDIAIVGTPYNVDENYKLVACYLGADVNKKADKRPIMRRVNYKNNSFLITTYADEILREVQLYSIESELEQCAGRARLLRNDCTVYVFSAFPCEQAHIDSRNYLSGSLPE